MSQVEESALKPWKTASAVAAVALLALVANTSAHGGDFWLFDECPSRTPGVLKCVCVVTSGGEVVLGSRRTRLVHPVILQGGVSATDEAHLFISRFYGAKAGDTLTTAPQSVAGGLLGLFPESSTPPWLETIIRYVARRGPTSVNATLELARPASEIEASEYNLLGEEGVALRLPVKLHLENPILGSGCYIGSSESPFVWNLTSGTDGRGTPPGAAGGTSGTLHSQAGHEIVTIDKARLLDRRWAAPGASGCAGALSSLVDPVIDSSFGLPAAAGANSAVLDSEIDVASVGSVNAH